MQVPVLAPMDSKDYTKYEELEDAKQQRLIASYWKRGFLKTKEDEQALHMSFSPYKVARGLTKLKIRRRINRYWKNKELGLSESVKQILGHRLEITINGKTILGASFVGKVPDTSRKLHNLLKSLI